MKLDIPDAEFFKYNINLDPKLIKYLKDNITWEQQYINIYGKNVALPRLTAWYGKPYSYSGIKNTAKEIPDFLKKILNKVEYYTDIIGHNSVLLNYYQDGNSSIGYHKDNEKELGNNPIITSLSLGYSREFILKHNNGSIYKVLLNHGDVLVMGKDSQINYSHCINKNKKILYERINLTFRTILD